MYNTYLSYDLPVTSRPTYYCTRSIKTKYNKNCFKNIKHLLKIIILFLLIYLCNFFFKYNSMCI